MLDVAALVQQMRYTLSEIHDTITSLDTKGHDEKLDALESQRDEVFHQLQSAFEKESAELKQRRQAERDEIAEKRRREDEEIAARRRREDEEKASRDHDHDAERQHKLESERDSVEQETDEKMDGIEEQARHMLDEGHSKLKDLEERRREINRMIDEQMKAPLPPPPARRARRSTRASQGGVPAQSDSDQQQERTTRLTAGPQDPTQRPDVSDSRGVGSEESRDDGLMHAEPKSAEPHPESSSPEQASTEVNSSSQDLPQGQPAESVGLQQDLGNTPASHGHQSQPQDTVTESQPASGSDRGAAEAVAEDNATAADQVDRDNQNSSSQAPDQAAPSSEKSEQPGTAALANTCSDVGPSVQETLAEEEPADESANVEERKLDSDHGQERPQDINEAVSRDTPSQSQDQALEAEKQGMDISSPDTAKQSTEPSAAEDPQEAPSNHKRPYSSDPLTTSEVSTTRESATEDESDQSRPQPTAGDPAAFDAQAESEGPEGSDHGGLFHGVAKGGAAEEYVRMAEAESGQEPQVRGNTSTTPEQDSSSGHGQQHQQDGGDSSRGIEEPESIRVDTSTTEEETPGYTRQAEADGRPSSASGVADSVDEKARSPVGSEHGSDHLRSRDIESFVDEQEPRREPTLNQEKHVQSSSEYSELDHSRHLDDSSTGHVQPTTRSLDSPGAGSPDGEQLQEPEYGEKPQSEIASPASGLQQRDLEQRDLESTRPEAIDVGEINFGDALVSDKDPSGPISAQAPQEPHGDEQRGDFSHGDQKNPDHDTVSQLESDLAVQQDPSTSSLSVPATSSHDAQLGKDLSGSEEHGGFGGHESSQERQESQTSKEEHASGEGEEQLPRASSHGAPNVAEAGDMNALPHESASEHEPGDKRSDSGYETGMASSRNLEDSTTTLHEGQPVPGAEHSFASAPSEGEQEKTREPRPEQILEGSGKDVSPPRQGGEQDSGDHPVEETFDLSDSEPIPGTMTHGKDRIEDQHEELAGEDVSLHSRSHQQPADDEAVGATPGDNQRSMGINDSHNTGSPDREESLPHELSQQAGGDHAQTESKPTTHEADNIGSADSRSRETEEQTQQGNSQSAVGNVGHMQGASESNPGASDNTESEHQKSAPSTGEAEEMHPQGDDAIFHTSQEQVSEPGDFSDSSNARGTSPDQLGSWNSQAFSRPADENEFSFKKRADSVQVGRSHGPADRGADLPSIKTDGPNEDADEGLFAVPPTPRHEMEHEKSPQLQGDGESKPSSRASSRNGSTGGNTLSPRAAEGLGDPYSEGPDREPLSDTSASKEDMHQNGSQSQVDGPQANLDAIKTPESVEEQSPVPHDDAGWSSSRGELDHGQPNEPVTMAAGQEPHEASAVNDGSQQGQHHDDVSLQASGEQPSSSERLSDGSLQPEIPPGEQHSDVMNRSEVIDGNGGMQVGSGDQARDTSGDPDAQPSGSTKEHDLEQDGSDSGYLGHPTQQPSDDAYTRGESTEELKPRDMTTEPESEEIRQQSGETDNKSLSDNDQVHGAEASESRTSEDQPRGVSPEVAETASDRGVDEKNGDPPHLDQGRTQEPESDSGLGREQLEQDHANVGNAARPPLPSDRSSQHLDARHVNYDGEGYGVTPSSEYSNDPLADSTARDQIETHSTDTSTAARQAHTHSLDSPGSAGATRNDDPLDSGSETFETPLESADFRKPQEGSRSVTPGNFTRALDHLPDESAHTVQGTDDLFDDTDDAEDAEDQDDYGEAVVYQNSNESAEISPSGEKTVYSTRGDENNTALGGHRSSLSLGSVGHRSQGSISSMRDTTPVRPTFGSYIGGPTVVRADWAAEHEDELRPSSSLNPTPHLGPSTTHDTPEISPFALRNTPMPSNGSEQRGLTSSMWNPERPQTPTSATTQSNNPFATPQRQAESELDASLFVPRDVTHVRQDSVPASLHSQTTLDSSWSSPVHSSLTVDRHEPVIRDSWPAPAPGYQQYLSSWSSRPRGDTTSTSAEYDPFKPDIGAAPGGQTAAKPSSSYNPFLQRGRAESSVSAAPSNPSASNSPSRGSALFAKMRNIFEAQSPNGAGDVPASPGKTRPVSGVFHPVTSVQRNSQDSSTGQGEEERGGFLNEAEHEIDERSAFLRSDGHPSGH